jgi:hypothetical protein
VETKGQDKEENNLPASMNVRRITAWDVAILLILGFLSGSVATFLALLIYLISKHA